MKECHVDDLSGNEDFICEFLLCEFTFVMKGFSGHRNVFLYKGLWLCRLLQFWERWRFDG